MIRPGKGERQSGVALLTALLIVALATTFDTLMPGPAIASARSVAVRLLRSAVMIPPPPTADDEIGGFQLVTEARLGRPCG